MMLIPLSTLTVWRTRARRGALSKLKSLLEFRELARDFKAEGVLMQAYTDAAQAMLCSAETLRDDMGKIREYSEAQLIYWITNGVSFDHLETANRLAEVAKKTPAQLLNEAIDPGNATGATMTVKELKSHALGEINNTHKPYIYKLIVFFERLGKLPSEYNWGIEKTDRFMSWLGSGKEFLDENTN